MEKIKLRFILSLKLYLYNASYWIIAFCAYVFFTGDNELFVIESLADRFQSFLPGVLAVSLTISLVFSIIDFFITDRSMRLFLLRAMPIFRFLLFLVLVVLVFDLSQLSLNLIIKGILTFELKELLPEMKLEFWRFAAFMVLAYGFNAFLKNAMRRIGRSNQFVWDLGIIRRPREEERIFMFLDLKNSTSIAEQLGHKRFSYLIQDIFNDMAIVDNYGGEIYQYLGDGAIISWSRKTGLANQACLKAFFAYQKLIDRRYRYYLRKYGLEPKFKAGMHIGTAMVLQVGRIRRDISYNGDVLNTAARIEAKCNEYRKSLLISEQLYVLLEHQSAEFRFNFVEKIKLKGKKKSVSIYAIGNKSK